MFNIYWYSQFLPRLKGENNLRMQIVTYFFCCISLFSTLYIITIWKDICDISFTAQFFIFDHSLKIWITCKKVEQIYRSFKAIVLCIRACIPMYWTCKTQPIGWHTYPIYWFYAIAQFTYIIGAEVRKICLFFAITKP